MKKTPVLLIFVIALVAYLFLKKDQTVTVTGSKTVGVTPATAGMVQSLINGLSGIFSDSSSSLNIPDATPVAEGLTYYS